MIRKYRKFRAHIDRPGVKPISFVEWWLGRASALLAAAASERALRRGDHQSLNAALLSIWAGNQSGEGLSAHRIPPYELSRALREGRISIHIESKEQSP